MKTNKMFIIGLFLICTLLFGACNNTTTQATLVKPKIEKTLAPMPSLEEAEVVFDVTDDAFGKTLSIYLKVDDKKDVLDTVKEKFGFEQAIGEDSFDHKIYKNNKGAEIQVKPTGAFEYMINNPGEGITLSEEEMEEKAEALFAELNIDVEGFERAGSFDMTSGDENQLLRKTICYEKKVDGYDVVGLSRINVGFAEDEIYTLGLLYSGREKAFDIEAKSKEYVEENFIKDMLDINIKNDTVRDKKIKRVEVTGVEIVYLDVCYDKDQPHIQPLYRFSGKLVGEDGTESGFESLMSAVPNQYFSLD